MLAYMNTDRYDTITKGEAREHDTHWEEVIQLAEKYGFVRQAYGGAAILVTHEDMTDTVEDDVCEWSEDETCGAWGTGCGHLFCIENDNPAENGMKYCPYCGKEIREVNHV